MSFLFHTSGLAHHAHPVPHLMNSRPARSVVVTWTWFRSQCTWHVSLQRLMRRHLLPSTGSLGLVPPLQRYYEVLRLPAAHFAALRFLRLAIPSLRPLFVPPGPGRGAVDQSGVGRRYLQPPCSMEDDRVSQVPGGTLVIIRHITSARKLLTNRSYGVSYHLCSG